MKWEGRKQSRNVDDRRDQSSYSGSGGGQSLGAIMYFWPLIRPLLRSKLGLLIVGIGAVAYFGGFIGLPSSGGGTASAPINAQRDDRQAAFIKTVLADTEAVWSQQFAQAGARYRPPTLVLYRGGTSSGCGPASSGMGPFYCPQDQKVYVDLGFFDELETKFGAGGDFANAYVLAHEIGHHIQNMEGTLTDVQRAKQQLRGKSAQNKLQVKVELQADCYAGLWANQAQKQFDILEEGDLEEALTTASAIGDDRLQKQSQGFAIPHTFTHGTSKQRMVWFTKGFKNGTVSACDTF